MSTQNCSSLFLGISFAGWLIAPPTGWLIAPPTGGDAWIR